MAVDASTAVMLFFLTAMLTPLVLFFTVGRFSVYPLRDLVIRRAMLVLFLLFAFLASSVAGVLSVKSDLGVQDLAFTITQIVSYGFICAMMAVFVLSIKDYLWLNQKQKRVPKQEADDDDETEDD